MKRRAFFFRIGDFSLINDAVLAGMREEFSHLDWEVVDVERDIVGGDVFLRARATIEAMGRYGAHIAKNRQPPRDFFGRLPVVLAAVQSWVKAHVDPPSTAMIFQTQSLFDARHPELPHFLYTDHTYLANLRYPEPKPLLPVAGKWRTMERNLYANATCNFVSSGFAARSLIEDYRVPENQVETVFSGSNVAVGPEDESLRKENVILFVGVDWERKGGPELLTAFREVRKKAANAELWIVGCSPAIQEKGIRVRGRLTSGEVAQCYREAAVFCLPSRMDPSASVLAEAAAQGLPVVATPVGGNAERVEDGVTGFLCEPGELADRLGRLLRNADLRRRLGEAGRRMATERFTWEAVCKKMARRMRNEMKIG